MRQRVALTPATVAQAHTHPFQVKPLSRPVVLVMGRHSQAGQESVRGSLSRLDIKMGGLDRGVHGILHSTRRSGFDLEMRYILQFSI